MKTKTTKPICQGEHGSTIVECMIAAAIFATTASVVYPMFSDARRVAKRGDALKLCQNAVKSKLEEYRLGKATNPNWAAQPNVAPSSAPEYPLETISSTDKLQLLNLTVPARTATSVSAGGGALATNGFTYAKVRYNRYFPTVCNGVSTALRLASAPNAAKTLGMRECLGSSRAWEDPATVSPELYPSKCSGSGSGNMDALVAGQIPGFKLYVKLERTTPWPMPSLTAGNLQHDPACPNSGGWSAGAAFDGAAAKSMYDFNGNGDGIRVTVTGVMDTESSSAALNSPVSILLKNFLGIDAGTGQTLSGVGNTNWAPFTCAAQTELYPEAFPLRYYLSTDGRIYPVQGGGINGGTRWVLPTLYTQNTTMLSSGITSFAIHPRNSAVYVLRPGSLTRYGNCGGSVLDCSASRTASNGISDDGQAGWRDVQEFGINPSIRYIAMDFRNHVLYGMTADRSAVHRINIDCLQTSANCGNGVAPTITYSTVAPGTFPAPPAAMPNRLSGFFIAPTGEDAFVSDISTSLAMGATSYAASVYRATDTTLRWPIVRLPVSATSFSK